MSYPPQGGFGQYSGLGAYAPPPPPPKRNRTLLIVLVVIGAVVLIGGGITAIVLIPRSHSTAQATDTAPPSAPPPVAQITNDDAGIRYQVPASWHRDGSATADAAGLTLGGVAEDYPFDCGGQSLIRAQVLSGSESGVDPAELAASVAAAIALNSYTVDGDTPDLSSPQTQVLDRDGHRAVQVTVTATTPGSNPCYAPKGQVSAVALATAAGAAVVVLNVAQGGPHADHAPTGDQVRALLASATLTGGGG